MSRRRLPRRFAKLRHGLFWGVVAVLTAFGAPAALAQAANAPRNDREPIARTVIGAANSGECTRYAMGGENSDVAVAACQGVIENHNTARADRVAALINRGTMRLRRHEAPLAVADFDAAIALDRRNPEAHLNRGAALIMNSQPGPAVAAITTALSLGVREPHKAYYNRGAAREALGDLRGAYEDYTTALQIRPDWGPANAELARFVRMRQERLAGMLNGQQVPSPTP